MLDIKDFSFFENQNSFDFKGFLIKTISYWKWFVLGLIITFAIARQVNIRKQKIFGMQTTIAVKEENNPFFTANTSLVFNWGGSSDKVQNISTTLKSRSHNELVVEKLQFYIDYLVQSKYYLKDVYGSVPFKIAIDTSKGQLYNSIIKIKFLSKNQYEIKTTLSSNRVIVSNYSKYTTGKISVNPGEFVKRFNVGEQVELPFLNWKLELNDFDESHVGKEYIVRFNSFDDTVLEFQKIKVTIDEKATSILKLSLEGTNKYRMVDYLNATVEMLIQRQLENKNQFAKNTILFID
jgi:hypothetical protein